MSTATSPANVLTHAKPADDGIVVTAFDADDQGGLLAGVLRAYQHQSYEAGYCAALRQVKVLLRMAGAEFIRCLPLDDRSSQRLRDFQRALESSIDASIDRDHFMADGLGI